MIEYFVGLLLFGVWVVDFIWVLIGLYCIMLLGDLGVDVVKVELLQGDDICVWGLFFQ